MPLPNGPVGLKDNPIIKSPFIQDWDQGTDFPPPATKFMVTESEIDMSTESGIKMITE